MGYLDDHPNEVKNASYYRRQLEAAKQEIAALKETMAFNTTTYRQMNDEIVDGRQRELELLAVIEELREALMGFIGNPTLEGYPHKKAAKALAHVEDINFQAIREHEAKVLEEVISEWEKPYTLTDGSKFIDRLRRMAEERRNWNECKSKTSGVRPVNALRKQHRI